MPFLQESFGAPGASQDQHIRMLRVIADAITSINVASVSIVAGGTAYVVGDVVTMTSTGAGTVITQAGITMTARFIVTSETAGVVDGLKIESCGAYSTAPDVTATSIATTGGTGTGLTIQVTTQVPYELTPVAAGSSYVVGDIITVTDFTGSVDPTFRVTAVTGGAVDTLSQETLGTFAFDEAPITTSATTGGTGTGLTVTAAKIGWKTQTRDDVDDETDFEFIVRGTNLAGSDPYWGAKTFISGGSAQWGMLGATGYSDTDTFENQPGGWGTKHVGEPPVTGSGMRVALRTSGTFELFLSIKPRRIIGVMRSAPAAIPFYAGLFSPFVLDPANQYPLPMYVAGTHKRDGEDITDNFSNNTAPMATFCHHGSNNEQTALRWIDGTWKFTGAGVSSSSEEFYLFPYHAAVIAINTSQRPNNDSEAEAPNVATGAGTIQPTHDADMIGDNAFNSAVTTGQGSVAPLPFGTGNQTQLLVPFTVINDIGGIAQVVGELEGVFNIHGNGFAAEDRVDLPDGRTALVMNSINATGFNRWYAITED